MTKKITPATVKKLESIYRKKPTQTNLSKFNIAKQALIVSSK